jgi:RNA methyltransferase, TrmH family
MITSVQNPKIQWVRSLISHRQVREETNAFVVEGVRLAEEALASKIKPLLVLFSSQLSERGREISASFAGMGVQVEEISPRLMETIADTNSPQGLVVVLPIPKTILPKTLDFVIVADNLRDPGNLGTLLRTAAASGAQAVLLTPGTTDAFAPKVLRAGMGAHFHLSILSQSWDQIRSFCKDSYQPPLNIYLAETENGIPFWKLDLRQPLALVIGGEADGASQEGRDAADANITIPMPGKSESLNAAIAAGILIFEVVRQRSL